MSAALRREAPVVVVIVALLAMPWIGSDFFVGVLLTRILILSLVAASLIFLSAYGGMVSLGQTAVYGVAAFAFGNAAVESGSNGLQLGLNPWVSVLVALVVTGVVAAVFGAVASRTTGIYFLMLTLIYAVIVFNLVLQVPDLSGSGGITGVDPPALLDGPIRLYFLALGLSVAAYYGLRGLTRTPFGIALQGVRDDPVRMASLGYHVPAVRTLAFVVAGLLAGLAGLVFVWWNGTIAPRSIGILPTIDILVIAVIGGISRLEGAWIGASIFVLANQYLREIPGASAIGLTEDRFNTVIGLVVLLIVVLSPEGVTGVWERLTDRLRGRTSKPSTDEAVAEVGPHDAETTTDADEEPVTPPSH